jgi:inhibitor of KinA sporulation pathway (predicted exonuclease)
MRPPCFSSDEQFEDYMARLNKTAPKEATCCWDCTAQYQREMIEEERCQYPEVKFVLVQDPQSASSAVQGVR